jgi:hypothetical protein
VACLKRKLNSWHVVDDYDSIWLGAVVANALFAGVQDYGSSRK